MDTALSLRNVYAGYGDRTVIHGLDADIPRGRICAVLGPGGSGKSTLLKLLEGTAQGGLWHSGELPRANTWRLQQSLRGADVEGERIVVRAQAVIEAWARRSGALSRSLLATVRSNPRLAARLARTLEEHAEVLLLDEIDSAAGAEGLTALVTALRHLRNDGRTIVLVTHNLELARRAADYVLLLVDGSKLFEGSPAHLYQASASHSRVRDFFIWGG